MTIGIYSRVLKEEHIPYVVELIAQLSNKKITFFVFDEYYKALKKHLPKQKINTFKNHQDVKKNIDLLITLGGDGTLLDTLHLVRDSEIPVAGINMGRLGFLADIHKEEIKELIESIEQNTYSIEDRTLISVETSRPVFGEVNYGLNEFTIHKTDSSSMIVVHVYLNGEFLNSFWADGLIIATPTGSTAYSLSCGGPIVFPTSGTFVLTPVAPHNLNARPIIIADNTVLSFEVECRSNNFLCSIDSRSVNIDNTFQLAVKKAGFSFKLLRMPESSYLSTLREKLNWGEDSRNS
ncbi:MAG TPA: NAD kinase [Chitinophagales bacterium]|nr:NAD kinase [Chitinophagales bacterium]